MHVPQEATRILARMRRRGYLDQHLSSQIVDGRRQYSISVERTFWLGISIERVDVLNTQLERSMLACCREIERQWLSGIRNFAELVAKT